MFYPTICANKTKDMMFVLQPYNSVLTKLRTKK